MTEDPGFIRRWSRRKQAARGAAHEAEATPSDDPQTVPEDGGAPVTAGQAAEDAGRGEQAEAAEPALDLPDIDGLTEESDFTPFMKKGVPKDLRNRALRKLWRVNPAFGKLDGLNDYDGDFTDSATVVKGLKTAYKVGRGFLADPEPLDETPAADDGQAEPEQTAESGDSGPPDEPDDPSDSNNVA